MKPTILLVDEAVRALKRKPISLGKLLRMLNGYDMKDLPNSEQSRQLAHCVLSQQGYTFAPKPKPTKKKVTKR